MGVLRGISVAYTHIKMRAGKKVHTALQETTLVPQLSIDDINTFLDDTVAHIAQHERLNSIIRSWERRCELHLTDSLFTAWFTTQSGLFQRLTEEEFNALALPIIRIETTTVLFTAIFFSQSISLVKAYMNGKVQLVCSPSDMLRLNRLFNLMLHTMPLKLCVVQETPSVDISFVSHKESQSAKKRTIIVSDTTLRDGEQMPGIRFTPQQKLLLAQALNQMGIAVLEVGYPAVSPVEQEAVRQICDAGLNAMIQVISRPLPHEITLAAKCGVQSIAIFIGTSDLHLTHKLRMTRDELCRTVENGVRFARQYGLQVAFAPEDATRTQRDFLLKICGIAIESGAEVIGIPDTVGIMLPDEMRELIADIVTNLRVPVAAHCHNDFGLATANSLAAVVGGAAAVQCSLGGIGERAGNASLEEVVCALELRCGCTTQIDLTQLQSANELLYSFLPFSASPNKAIVGKNAFTHESGLHTSGVIREASTYEPFDPALLGRSRRFVFGKHSGRQAIVHVLEQAQITVTEQTLDDLVLAVKRLGDAGTSLSESELVQLARSGKVK